MNITRFRARWIFPVASAPLENGVLEVTDGVISAVHHLAEPDAIELGNVAILPGLVNAHTHLEFSDLTAPLTPEEPFTDWIRELVAHRRLRTVEPKTIIAKGFGEAIASETRCLGEIATEGWSPDVFAENPKCQTVVFRELIGLLPEQIAEQVSLAKTHLGSALAKEQPWLTRGLSPHAPYSVHPQLFQKLVSLCREHNAPLAMHLAETRAELELLSRSQGELVEMLKAFGVWREGVIAPGSRILDYLKPMADLNRGLVVHGNYLNDQDIAFLSRHPNLSVVYCPRTHAFFGHRLEDHPWPRLLDANVRVALGTDSRASNPDLNLWNEVRFLRKHYPKIPPAQWLKWATQNGALALDGPETTHGTLEPGKQGVFSTLPLKVLDTSDPDLALFG